MSEIGTPQPPRDRVLVRLTRPVQMSCRQCGTTDTPLWRYGPEGSKSLCNACGIRWKRANKYRLSGGIRKRKHVPIAASRHHPKIQTKNDTFNHFLETVEGTYSRSRRDQTHSLPQDEYEHETHEAVLAPASPAIVSAPMTDDESEAVASETETEADRRGAMFLHFFANAAKLELA